MDVSFVHTKSASLLCDHCGYPRRGLKPASACPECGKVCSRPADPSPGIPAVTRNQQRQFRLAFVGLAILMIASFYAIRVALIMQHEALTGINVPSPKVCGVAMVQREVGGRPGEWGVLGWMTALWSLVGVWLITARRSPADEQFGWTSLRQRTRWGTLLLTGGLAGLLLGDLNNYIPLNGIYSGRLVLLAMICVEIPVNFCVYLYLRSLALQSRQPRVAKLFTWCAWGGAIMRVLPLAVALPSVPYWEKHELVYAAISIVIGACSVTIGAASWCAVAQLAAGLFRLAYHKPMRRGIALLRNRRGGMRSLVEFIQRHGPRLCVIAGLLLWAYHTYGNASGSLTASQLTYDRIANSPTISFAGPKIGTLMQTYAGRWESVSIQSDGLLTELCVILLLTVPLSGQTIKDLKVGQWTRWGTIIAICGAIHIIPQFQIVHRHPIVTSYLTRILIDAPASAITFFYLARIARLHGSPRVQTDLNWLAWIVPALIFAPTMFLFPMLTWDNHHQLGMIAVAFAGLNMIDVIVTLCGLVAIMRLAGLVFCSIIPAKLPYVNVDRHIKQNSPTGEPIGLSLVDAKA